MAQDIRKGEDYLSSHGEGGLRPPLSLSVTHLARSISLHNKINPKCVAHSKADVNVNVRSSHAKHRVPATMEGLGVVHKEREIHAFFLLRRVATCLPV